MADEKVKYETLIFLGKRWRRPLGTSGPYVNGRDEYELPRIYYEDYECCLRLGTYDGGRGQDPDVEIWGSGKSEAAAVKSLVKNIARVAGLKFSDPGRGY
jgi:hypothetical protein